jgi:hypothetical protein
VGIPLDRHFGADQCFVWDHGPREAPNAPRQIQMHVTDANHAMRVEPDRYKLDPDKPKPKPKSTVRHIENDGAVGLMNE